MAQPRRGLDRVDCRWLCALALLAGALRLPALTTAPPAFQFDEAYNALDALEVLAGYHRLFLPANGGREVLYTYLQAPLVALLGPTALAGRLTSAIVGIVTVCLLYVFVRRLWPGRRRLAGLAGVLLALSYWHLHFSRYGIRSILSPLWFLLTLLCLWRGLIDGRMRWYALCGLLMAANVWTHPTGRLAPFIVLPVAALAAFARPEQRRRIVIGVVVAGGISLLFFAPLGWHYIRHPVQFYGHASDVSIIRPGDAGATLVALAENAGRILAMFNLRGSGEWIHNLPGRPVFDFVTGIAFLLGAGLTVLGALKRQPLERLRHGLLVIWATVLATVSVVTDMAPNYSRMLGALPVFVIMAALGLDWLATRAQQRVSSRVARLLLGGVLALGGGLTVYDYFGRFATAAEAYYAYDGDKIEAASFLSMEAADNTLFLAELWAQHATIRVLTGELDIRALDTRSVMVLPNEEGKGALYVFPPEQKARAEALAGMWAGWGELRTVFDRFGNELLYVYGIPEERLRALARHRDSIVEQLPLRLQAADLPLGDSIVLRGWQTDRHADARGRLAITLLWECLEPVPSDLTAFVHLVDDRGEKLAQIDQEPGAGSYETSEWRAGDLVLDEYRVPLPPITPLGGYEVQAGLYRLMATQDAPMSQLIEDVELGSVWFDGVVPASLDAMPEQAIIMRGNDGLLAAVSPQEIEVLDPEPLTLVLSPEEMLDGAAWHVQLRDADSSEVHVVGELTLPENAAWRHVEALYVTTDLIVSDLEPGEYELQVAGALQGVTVALGAVDVVPSQRHWTAPDVEVRIDALFGDWVRLIGVLGVEPGGGEIVVEPGRPLSLALAWQATGETSQSLSVFVHLVSRDGDIIAQHDGIPHGGQYATSRWLSGEVVVDEVSLDVAADAPSGEYALLIGLYDRVTGEREPVEQGGRQRPDAAAVVPVTVIVGDD